jgi:hypothetical protein
MNDNIKEMAEEAGMTNTLGCFWQCGDEALAKLYEMAFRAGGARPWWSITQEQWAVLNKKFGGEE